MNSFLITSFTSRHRSLAKSFTLMLSPTSTLVGRTTSVFLAGAAFRLLLLLFLCLWFFII